MQIEFNYYWGLIGFLGTLGYVLENPMYYVFFVFFLLFLVPVFNKRKKSNEKSREILSIDNSNSYDLYTVSIWLGSVVLIIDSFVLMIWKTMSDYVTIGLLLGIMIFMANFFTYFGMEKPKDERLRKIGTSSATYSWYITLIFICFILITGYWSGVPRTGPELLGVTIFMMVTTTIIINTYLNLKGDME